MPISAKDLVTGLAEITGVPVTDVAYIDRWLTEESWRPKGKAGRGGSGSVKVDEEYAARLLLGLCAPHTKAAPALVRGLQNAFRCTRLEGLGEIDAEIRRVLGAREKVLESLEGIGPWTANMIALRAVGEPDAFPAGDLGLRKALANGSTPLTTRILGTRAEAWRPWRGYAAMALWLSGSHNIDNLNMETIS